MASFSIINFCIWVIRTSKLFNSIYSIEDRVVTLVDYELWLPRLFTLSVKETSQLREGRSFFDFQKLKARYEEKKVSKKKGVEEKKAGMGYSSLFAKRL